MNRQIQRKAERKKKIRGSDGRKGIGNEEEG